MEQYYFDTLPLHPPPERLESFTGYIIRLAQANGMKTMEDLAYVFFPETVHRHNHRGLTKYFTDYTPPSFGTLTKVALCSEARLHGMTFFHLAKKFDRLPGFDPLTYFLRNVVSSYLRYCPCCLSEHPLPYYSLEWRLLPICYKHYCSLLDQCGHCGGKIPIFTLPPKIAICPSCKGDLRTCRSPSLTLDELAIVSISSSDIEFLLTPHQCEEKAATVTAVGTILSFMRRTRKLSGPQLAQVLQINHGAIESIEQTTSGITLLGYAIYAKEMGISLQDLFTRAFSQEYPQKYDPEEVLIRLVEAAIPQLEYTTKQINAAAVSRLIGVSASVLRHYPRVRSLLAQYQENDNSKETRQLLREEKLLDKAYEARESLLALGKSVTVARICKYLQICNKSLTKYPRVKEFIDRSCEENRAKRIEAREQREDNLVYSQVRKKLDLTINHASEKPLKEEELLKLVQEMAPSTNPFDKRTLYRMIRENAGPIYGNPKKYPQVRQFIDEYAKVCRGQRREDEKTKRRQQQEEERFSRLQEAAVSLQSQGKALTWLVLAEASGIRVGLLRYYPRLREYVTKCIHEAAAYKYLIDQQQDEELLQRLQQVIQTQKLSNKSLSRETLSKILHVSKERLLTCPQTKAVLEELQRDLQSDRLRQEMIIVEQVNKAILSLRDQGCPITQRGMSKYLGIARTQLNSYPKVREILITEMDTKYSAIDGTEQP